MPEEITFTTAAFGGFEKKQVLDYILKMHEELDKDKEKQRKKLEDISYAFKELEQRALRAEREKDLLQQQLNGVAASLQNEKNRSEHLRQSGQELQQKLEQVERILAQRKKQDDSPVETPPEVLPQTNEQLSYDHSAQIGKVMLDAHSKANRIVEEAKGEAAQILGTARHNLDARMKQNDTYLQQYTAAKEAEAKRDIAELQSRAHSQISGIYDYLDSLIGSLITTADDSKSQFTGLSVQVSNIRASWQGGALGAVPVHAPTPMPEPVLKQEAPPVDLHDYKLSEKYSSLFEYEPNVIEKPRIEYSKDYPYNPNFPEASTSSTPPEATSPEYPPLDYGVSPPPPDYSSPKAEESYNPQYTNYDDKILPTPPITPIPETPIYSNPDPIFTPEQPYAYPQNDNLSDKGIADNSVGNKRSLVFNFEHAHPESLSTSLDSDEITFPSLHPVDFSQPPTEND